MENRLQATFMPRQTAVPGGISARPKTPVNFLMVIGILVFLLILGGMGALYAYRSFLTASNQEKKGKIEQAIKDFEPELTAKLTLLKTRLDAGRSLLDNHRAFSLLFQVLEMNTAKTVQLTQLSYTVGADKMIKITVKGFARSYNAVAFQSDIFSKIDQFKNTMFTNIVLNQDGTIGFDFTADLDSSTVLYKNLVASLGGTANPGMSGTTTLNGMSGTSGTNATSTTGSTTGNSSSGTNSATTSTTTNTRR